MVVSLIVSQSALEAQEPRLGELLVGQRAGLVQLGEWGELGRRARPGGGGARAAWWRRGAAALAGLFVAVALIVLITVGPLRDQVQELAAEILA